MTRPRSSRRIGRWTSSMLFLLALVVGLIAINDILMQPELRARIDATKSRSYSLSPRSQQLLAGLEGPWSITVVMVDAETDPAVVSQIDEVLDRYADAAPSMTVQRIDPSMPGALTEYDRLLMELRDREAEAIESFERTVRNASEEFENLVAFAGPTADRIDRLVTREGEDAAAIRDVEAIAAALRLLGQQGHLVLEAVEEMRERQATLEEKIDQIKRDILKALGNKQI